jgi:hypothetical protein
MAKKKVESVEVRKAENGFIIMVNEAQSARGPWRPPRKFVATDTKARDKILSSVTSGLV